MKAAYDSLRLPWQEFEMPEGVVEIKICKETKLLPRRLCPIEEEIYNKNYLPTDLCPVHVEVISRPSKKRGREKW